MTTIYYVSVILISLLVFFLKITAPHWLGEIVLKTAGKIIPVFCIVYSCIELVNVNVKYSQKFDYQIELINQNDVRIMDENNKTLYITTFDSLTYYIEKDNL